jgi:glycosyltransferase involved in cell wall biosynthesis
VIISNDWLTLPIGAAVKRRTGAALVYDSHEFATREHIQNWKWRLVSAAAVSAIESTHIGQADLVITVSDGIADALKDLYRLPTRPLVVRNVPEYQEIAFRPSRRPIEILFHGLIRQERGLEELIAAIPSWRMDARLTIRGHGSPDYLAELRRRAAVPGTESLVAFQPSVPQTDVVSRAATADIGFQALPATTENHEFALPNKFFEYLMAGLAVLATPRREVANILRSSGAGLTAELHPQTLADTLNSLTIEKLNTMRQAALAAARLLNWGAEKKRLTEAVESLRPLLRTA